MLADKRREHCIDEESSPRNPNWIPRLAPAGRVDPGDFARARNPQRSLRAVAVIDPVDARGGNLNVAAEQRGAVMLNIRTTSAASSLRGSACNLHLREAERMRGHRLAAAVPSWKGVRRSSSSRLGLALDLCFV